MAADHAPMVPTGGGADSGDAAVQRQWRTAARLSSIPDSCERFLADAGFDRGPWLVVAFGLGIASWFVLASPWQWVGAITGGLLLAFGAVAAWHGKEDRTRLLQAAVALGLMFSAGVALVWLRSAAVGAEPIERPVVAPVQGYVIARQDQSAQDRVRLVMAIRDAEAGISRKIRVNVPFDQARPEMAEGAILRMRVRLMPPAPPMLPGAHDFASNAWFQSLAATGSVIGPIELVRPGDGGGVFAPLQRSLSEHVRSRLGGSPGSIAAAFASGDRGAISRADEEAMRDAGLTHLLSISGLHVSAVIAAAYLLTLRLLALWPALALRVRLPVVAAASGALAGVFYTLLTGSEVPTVRSCLAALLVLGALAMGREALSLRMIAVAGFAVLLFWPEAIVGPSFQMSFAAVLTIVALHQSEIVRRFLGPREEGWLARLVRGGTVLLATGMAIEIALTPIVLFHFHRAGLYGAIANVIAIPLVTFVAMPLIALALLLDLAAAGAPAWWLAGHSLELLLDIAHFTASRPGAVKLMPQMSGLAFALFIAGGLWLALWRGRLRLWGLLPAAAAFVLVLMTPVPDVLISGDGRQVGIVTADGRLISLRESRSNYARDNLMELAGVEAQPLAIERWPGARCSSEFCFARIERGGRDWTLLLARNRIRIEERALAAACEQADIVVADRWLTASCHPRWLKADRRLLSRTGGLALMLERGTMTSVAASQGQHGWWRGGQ